MDILQFLASVLLVMSVAVGVALLIYGIRVKDEYLLGRGAVLTTIGLFGSGFQTLGGLYRHTPPFWVALATGVVVGALMLMIGNKSKR